ncbi:hypothetical protein HMPREF9517_00933 [Enterococcus faecalis TX1341]|nr:hypothetical protein HMPREF9517_00933 [Enterococcus faecalis TX1341]
MVFVEKSDLQMFHMYLKRFEVNNIELNYGHKKPENFLWLYVKTKIK